MLKGRIRLADRQGLLKGDLNLVQDLALQYLVAEENEERFAIEEERMKYTIFAANPEMGKALFKSEDEEENVNWITPETVDQVETVLADYDRIRRESVPI